MEATLVNKYDKSSIYYTPSRILYLEHALLVIDSTLAMQFSMRLLFLHHTERVDH